MFDILMCHTVPSCVLHTPGIQLVNTCLSKVHTCTTRGHLVQVLPGQKVKVLQASSFKYRVESVNCQKVSKSVHTLNFLNRTNFITRMVFLYHVHVCFCTLVTLQNSTCTNLHIASNASECSFTPFSPPSLPPVSRSAILFAKPPLFETT